MVELYALPYSPWSEKARWALDHHGVEYKERPYVPMLGEPYLRLRTRRLTGRVTVPVLLGGGDETAIFDSYAIARWADGAGRGSKLVPDARRQEIDRIVSVTEVGMAAGRALTTRRVAGDTEAKLEAIPGPLRRALGARLLPLADMGVRFFKRKYGLDSTSDDEDLAVIRRVLDEVRSLRTGGSAYLAGDFSFADIAAAALLSFVSPVGDAYVRIGPATRRAWTDADLAHDYDDLVTWRDDLYSQHRR